MSPARSWFAPLAVVLALAVVVSSCKDKGGGITPPEDAVPVASVSITPATASVSVGDTLRLTATVRDADGNTLTDRIVTWSTSSTSLATVSQTGLVTAVAEGQVTITATAEGKSGTSAVGVAARNVVATGTLGPSGGSVGTPEVGVSVAPGALPTSTKVEIVKATDTISGIGTDRVTDAFVLKGFPTDRETQVRVRLKVKGTLRDKSMIGMAVPVYSSSVDSVVAESGLLVRFATDSAGYLVATVPVRGTSSAGPAPQRADGPQAAGGLLDGILTGFTGARADTVATKDFVFISFGAPRAELNQKVARAAKLLQDAKTTLQAQGYSFDHRRDWPIEVHVSPLRVGLYGSFSQKGPFPLDVNTGWFKFNTWAFDQPDIAGTVIHEFFHFVQARYTVGLQEQPYAQVGWLKEAGSTWVEEKAPETMGVFRNSFFQSQRDDLFKGVYPSLTAKDGYGKAPVMKYVADRWGTPRVRAIFESVGAGNSAAAALLQGIPEAPATWWPDVLTKYMQGNLVALAAKDLPEEVGDLPFKPGYWTWTWANDLRPLAAQINVFTPDPAKVGTGTQLILRIPAAHRAAGFRFLPFRMGTGDKWEAQGGVADSLVIKGADLKLGRRYGVYVIHTTPTAPYTQTWKNQIVTDLGYMEGDFATRDVTVTNDAIAYTRPEGDTTRIDVVENVTGVFSSLSAGGVWQRDANNPNLYTWKGTDAFLAQLAFFKATASASAQVYATGDSLYLKALVDMNPPAAPTGEPGQAAFLGGAGLLLLLGVALRRNRRVMATLGIAAVALGVWGCDLGSINLSARFSYEFRLANPSLTASAEDPTEPLVKLDTGTGKVTVERYRAQWWEYVRDDAGKIVDSVAKVRTATGSATVRLGADHYADGVITDDDETAEAAAGMLQVPLDVFLGRRRELVERR